MEQDTDNFLVQSATTYKPKVITKENFKKLKKEGEHQLVFYPQYVEIIKTKKKGKDYTKRFIRSSDVTKVTTDEKNTNLLRVFVTNNRGDTECHQISIDNSAEFKIAKDYFEKKTQNGTSGRNSPMEALPSGRHPTSIMSEKAGSRRPPSGRWAPAEEKEDEQEEEDLRPVDGGFGGGAYSQDLPMTRSGYRPYDRMSGAPSEMVASYISTSDQPRSSRPRYNGYQDEDTATGNDFNSEYDPQTRHSRYKSSYVHAKAPHSHAGRHYSRGGSTVFDGEDFRDYPRDYPGSAYDDHADHDHGAGYSEEDEETYTVDYAPHSNRVIERPNRPRSLPYYVPFLSVPHSRNAYW